MERIEWAPDEAARKAGITCEKLTGGVIIENNGIKAVRFDERVKGQRVALRIDTRPELASHIAALEAKETEEREAEELKKKIALKNMIESGEAFLTLEIADQYGAEIKYARRFREEEKGEYAEWFKDFGLLAISGDATVEIDRSIATEYVEGRKADGEFLGYDNNAWIITAEEMAELISLSRGEKIRKTEMAKKAEREEEDDIRHKIETGYCFYCESWCNGDCGHYSNDPQIRYSQEIKQAMNESNYGIND